MTYTNTISAGRVVLGGLIQEITLPQEERYVFDFTRYKWIVSKFSDGSGIATSNAASPRVAGLFEPADREDDLFWSRLIGFETGHNGLDDAENEYIRVASDFSVLSGGKYVYEHPELPRILAQLGVSRLMPFYGAEYFGLDTTGETIPMEVDQMRWKTGRTAAFRRAVTIDGKPYLLEVKGVNFDNGPIEPQTEYNPGESAGGLPVDRMEHSVRIKRHLNENGYDGDILVAAYVIPDLRQFDGKSLGAYVRAVPSSPPCPTFIRISRTSPLHYAYLLWVWLSTSSDRRPVTPPSYGGSASSTAGFMNRTCASGD